VRLADDFDVATPEYVAGLLSQGLTAIGDSGDFFIKSVFKNLGPLTSRVLANGMCYVAEQTNTAAN
jgi:hypothetical protein